MAKSLFRDKKSSACLMHFRASISLGRRRGHSRVSTTWQEWPLWNSLIEEFQGNAAPSNSNFRFQVGWRMSAECLASLLSTEGACPLSLVVFYYLGSFSGISSPSLAISFSFLFFFKFVMGSKSTMEGGRGGGSAGGSQDLKASLGPAPYPSRGRAILFFFFFVQRMGLP